ncbi:MAG: VOC family protein [Actinomycetaceae bacterium]|nr:VOC family protein [Actinomycetaceae bacterium]
MTSTGLDFVALQVGDIERSAAFYEEYLGLVRAPYAPEGAIVFATKPVPFAVRKPLPGVDMKAAAPYPGVGVALWFHVDKVDNLYRALQQSGAQIVSEPQDGPFGRTFSFSDPDGYVVTVHDKA